MNSLLEVSLVLTAALPVVAMVMAAVTGKRDRNNFGPGVWLTGLGFLLAIFLLVGVITNGPVSAGVENSSGEMIFGLYADRIVAVLLLLVLGVSAVVQAFSGRYLHGDVRVARFFIGANLLTAATVLMVASASLVGLAVGWSLAGLGLIVLLAMYPGMPAADLGVRRTMRAFLIGDLALWAAVVFSTVQWGWLDIRLLGDPGQIPAGEEVTLAIIACLIVIAALSRSAQLPFQGWLPATVAVPTPVSALLHAGVVNAGGILLIRMSPVFGESSLATHLAFIAGAATAIYGTALMLSKSDVKGALAHSTMGQMGFMIMTCGLGAWAAAVFHLVAHGMYKASLFLGSGSAVSLYAGMLQSPPAVIADRAGKVRIALFSVIFSGLVLLGVAALLYPDPSSSSTALLLFAWATGAWVAIGWLSRNRSARGVATAAFGLVLAAFFYVALLRGAINFLDPALASAGDETVGPLWVVAFFALMLLAGAARIARPSGPLAELHKNAYVRVLGAAQVNPPGIKLPVNLSTASPSTPGTLIANSEGAKS